MGTLGTDIKEQFERILNDERIRSSITITPRSPSISGSYGGYESVNENEGTSINTYCVPITYIEPRLGLLNFGDLKEGEIRVLIKPSETVDSNDKITFQSVDYDIREIKPIVFNDVKIAIALTLSKRSAE